MPDGDWAPIGEVLNGLNIRPLNRGSVAIETVLLVKMMDEDGDSAWALRYSEGVSRMEIIGSLSSMHHHELKAWEKNWVPDWEDDDD